MTIKFPGDRPDAIVECARRLVADVEGALRRPASTAADLAGAPVLDWWLPNSASGLQPHRHRVRPSHGRRSPHRADQRNLRLRRRRRVGALLVALLRARSPRQPVRQESPMTDDKGKSGIAALADARQGDLALDDADAFDARLAIGNELPRAMLLDALPKGLRRRLDRHEAVALTITVPGPDWCDAISGAVTEMWSSAEIFSRMPSRSEHKPSAGNGDVATALIEGRPVVGVSQDVTRFLPLSLVASADAHIVVAAPGPAVLRRRPCAPARVGRAPCHIPPGAAASLHLRRRYSGAFRAGASPRDVLANLVRVASAWSRISATDATPPLPDLPCLSSGAARAWGMDLIDGVARWRRGEAAWRDLSAAAVLAGPPGTGKTLFAKSLARGAAACRSSAPRWVSFSPRPTARSATWRRRCPNPGISPKPARRRSTYG